MRVGGGGWVGGGGQVVAECGGGDEMRGSEEAECLAASDACVCVYPDKIFRKFKGLRLP